MATATMTALRRAAGAKRPAVGRPGGGFALAVAVGASSVLSFGFHAVASRLLVPTDYSGLAALLALMVAALVPITAVQSAITRSVAHDLAQGLRPSGLTLLRRTAAGAMIMFGLSLAATPLVSHVVRLETNWPAVLMGAWLAASVPEAVMKGLLIGAGRLRPVAGSILSGALVRVVSLVALSAWASPPAAMAATVASELLIVAVLTAAARRAGLLVRGGHGTSPRLGDAGRALNCQLALWLYAALAAVVARRALSADEVGSFAAMATASGACIFLPQAVATAAFPRFVADRRPGLLLGALGLAGGVALACGSVMCAQPRLLFAVLFGRGYSPDALTLGLLVLHFAALGCLTVIAQHLVACRRRGAWALWSALATAGVLTMAAGHSPRSLAAMLAVPSVGLTALYLVQTARSWARHRAAERLDAHSEAVVPAIGHADASGPHAPPVPGTMGAAASTFAAAPAPAASVHGDTREPSRAAVAAADGVESTTHPGAHPPLPALSTAQSAAATSVEP